VARLEAYLEQVGLGRAVTGHADPFKG